MKQTRKWTRLTAALFCVGLLACGLPRDEKSRSAQVEPPAAATVAGESPAVEVAAPRDEFRGNFFASTGLAREENGKICFVSYSMALNPGMPILLVDPDKNPSFQVARLGPRLDSPCSVGNNLHFDEVLIGLPTSYEVELLDTRKESAAFTTWIGVPGASPGALTRNEDHQLEGDLDNDGTRERFFSWNSREGYHFSIRSISADKSRQRWHAYVYAGYEMEGR